MTEEQAAQPSQQDEAKAGNTVYAADMSEADIIKQMIMICSLVQANRNDALGVSLQPAVVSPDAAAVEDGK